MSSFFPQRNAYFVVFVRSSRLLLRTLEAHVMGSTNPPRVRIIREREVGASSDSKLVGCDQYQVLYRVGFIFCFLTFFLNGYLTCAAGIRLVRILTYPARRIIKDPSNPLSRSSRGHVHTSYSMYRSFDLGHMTDPCSATERLASPRYLEEKGQGTAGPGSES